MERSSCTSCGLQSQDCQCRRASTAHGGERGVIPTLISFLLTYLVTVLVSLGFYYLFALLIVSVCGLNKDRSSDPFDPTHSCHLEIFVDSFSVSNASTNAPANATADWNVSFVSTSPGNGCRASVLHMIKSRLFRGNKLISESMTPDYFGLLVTGKINEMVSYSVFNKVPTPRGGVVWDLGVSFVSSITISDYSDNTRGFLIVNCGDIPVNFTVDAAGNMKGSLLGYKRPCESLLRKEHSDIATVF